MDRRDFLKTTTGVAAAATVGGVAAEVAGAVPPSSATDALLTSPAIASGARRFVLALPQSLDHLEVRTAVQRLTRRLETALPGPAQIFVQATAESGLEAVSTGRADFYYGLDSQHAVYHPTLPVFAGMALGENLRSTVLHAWLTAGNGRELWQTALGHADAVAFPAGHTGPGPGLYTDVAFETGGDLKGVRIAARGIGADALRLLGADVSTHDTDGVGAIAARGLAASEPLLTPFDAKAQWSYYPSVTHSGLLLSLGTRGSLWASLSTADRAVIEGVAAEAYLLAQTAAMQRAVTLDQVRTMRRWPVETRMSDTLADEIRVAVAGVADGIASDSALGARVIDSYRRFGDAMTSRRHRVGIPIG